MSEGDVQRLRKRLFKHSFYGLAAFLGLVAAAIGWRELGFNRVSTALAIAAVAPVTLALGLNIAWVFLGLLRPWR